MEGRFVDRFFLEGSCKAGLGYFGDLACFFDFLVGLTELSTFRTDRTLPLSSHLPFTEILNLSNPRGGF